jgi:hypothetical protein
MRIRTLLLCSLVATACAKSDPKKLTADAPTQSDAGKDARTVDARATDARPDAATITNGLGAECTGQGQGTCPVGYDCLNLVGASGSWCSKTCTMGAGDTCDTGYTGPGVGSCTLNITPSGGGAPQSYCAIICQDEPGAPTLCAPSTRCNNTCTTPLKCTGALTNTTGGIAGHICQ